MALLTNLHNPFRRIGDSFAHLIDYHHFMGRTPFVENFIAPEKTNTAPSNVKKNAQNFVIQIALPGFSKDSISIHLEKGILKVMAVQNKAVDNENEDWILKEFDNSTLSRIFYLHPDVDEENIRAHISDGVLQIELPFKADSPEQPTRKIQVN
jgi:HSP20 family protein